MESTASLPVLSTLRVGIEGEERPCPAAIQLSVKLWNAARQAVDSSSKIHLAAEDLQFIQELRVYN